MSGRARSDAAARKSPVCNVNGASGGAPALSPEVVTVRFEDVVVLKVGGAPADPGLVPIGRVSTLLPLRTQAVVPTASLVNHVLAVSFATTEAQVPHVNVAGVSAERGVGETREGVRARVRTRLRSAAS